MVDQAKRENHEGGEAPRVEWVTLTSEFADRLPELSLEWQAATTPDPQVLVLNEALAEELGIDPSNLKTAEGAKFLTGEVLAQGSHPVAQLYSGHQFGRYSPILGDGRALLLGEITDETGAMRDIHLKGSGPTPPSRGDGFSALGPMLREFLMSEAMHALGVPTTRALAVTLTGRKVMRDDFRRGNQLPGAVLTRVAASHLRVGSFQYARATGDTELLKRLVSVAIDRHYPHLKDSASPAQDLLREVVRVQAHLVAQWMHVGFVHGVMNTDNMTISGETIDYGPCAFIDTYNPHAVFSSIDQDERYAYGTQPRIAKWNLSRLADALLPLIIAELTTVFDGADGADGADEADGVDEAQQAAIDAAQRIIAEFDAEFNAGWIVGMRKKLGLHSTDGPQTFVAPVSMTPASMTPVNDETVKEVAGDMLSDLAQHKVDYTVFFRTLTRVAESETSAELPEATEATAAIEEVRELFGLNSEPDAEEGATSWRGTVNWLDRWLALSPDAEIMRRTNPVVIPRNHLVDQALEAATDGDLAPFTELLDAVTHPFTLKTGAERFAEPPPSGSRRFVTYCGT